VALLTTYYRQFAVDSAAIAYVAHRHETGLVGWVVGAQKDKAFYNRFLRRRSLALGGHLLVSFMRDSYVRRYLWARRTWFGLALRALFGRSAKTKKAPSSEPTTRLIVIGLVPEQRGSGIAAALTDAFCSEAARRGDQAVGLSVKESNKAAVRFYQKDGWKLSETRSGTALFERAVAGNA
jgi:GNAT superfamily N-acetyltransferase